MTPEQERQILAMTIIRQQNKIAEIEENIAKIVKVLGEQQRLITSLVSLSNLSTLMNRHAGELNA